MLMLTLECWCWHWLLILLQKTPEDSKLQKKMTKEGKWESIKTSEILLKLSRREEKGESRGKIVCFHKHVQVDKLDHHQVHPQPRLRLHRHLHSNRGITVDRCYLYHSALYKTVQNLSTLHVKFYITRQ